MMMMMQAFSIRQNPEKSSTNEGGDKVSSIKGAASKVASAAISFGSDLIGKTKYVFGGGRSSKDIAKGVFDCSSFIHHAFKQAGKDLGALTSVTTDTLKKKGTQVASKDMKPGDLIFFDTYKKDGHVGIYLGDNKFIGAQTSTGVAVVDLSKDKYWSSKINGNVRRI